MALVVEDGAGLPTADAFDSLANVTAFLAARGFSSWAAADEPDQNAAIRRATAWLSNYYTWRGQRVKGRDQALAWPRSGAVDADRFPVPSDEVPIEVREALALAALVELARPGALTPTLTPSRTVRRQRVGPIDITYADLGRRSPNDLSGVDDSRPVLTDVYDRVKRLTTVPLGVGVTVA